MGKIKRSYVARSTLQTRWTGEQIIRVSSTHFAAINGTEVFIVDATSGNTSSKLEPSDDAEDKVFDVAVDPLMRFAVTSHDSMLVKFWTSSDSKWTVYKQWKFPGSNKPSLLIDNQCQKFAAMTANGGCWFYSVQTQKQLGKATIGAGQITAKHFDSKGNLWVGTSLGKLAFVNQDTFKSKLFSEQAESHAQRITGIADVGDYVFTAGTDEIVIVYTKEGQFVKTIAVQYPIQMMVGDPKQVMSCYCATTEGIKRVFIDKTTQIKAIAPTVATHLIYFDRLYSCDENGILASVDLGEGLQSHAIPLSLHSVYDAAYDETTETTAIATSSFSIIATKGLDTHLLVGHTNVPLCLAAQNGLLLSGAKDNTARLWNLEDHSLLCTLSGHANAVTAVAFVPKSSNVITTSTDHTIKMWQPESGEPILRSALCNVVAHNKEINEIDVSQDGTMLATASRDKTCKLFKISETGLTLARTLIGHTGALWSVAFSPVDRVVATSSKDQTIRIWNVTDGSCIANFTEFSSPVLRVRFITAGLQLVATEGAGIFKVLRTKTGAVDFTSPEIHKQSAWALAVAEDGASVVTGAEDGTLVIWDDNTAQLEEEEMQHKAEISEAEQELNNALRNGEFVRALRLALKLRMPAKLRTIIRTATEQNASSAIEEYFAQVDDIDDFEQWLEYTAKWATNSKWADDATSVLTAMLHVKPMKFFIDNRKNLQERIDGIIPYLERHMARLDRLHTQTYLIDHILDSTTLESK